MKPHGLLIAVGVLAALAGLVYWSNKQTKAEEGKPAADAAPKLVSLASDQIRRIEIKRKDGEDTVLRKNNTTWEMTSPEAFPVDQEAAASLAAAFNNLAADRLVEAKVSDFTQYGLSAPALEVVLTRADGGTITLQLGDDVPTGSGVFARLAGDPRLFVLASFNKISLDKSAKDLRDKRLLTFDADKLAKLELTARNQTAEFSKNGQGEWQITKPKALRADGGQVEELIRKLRDAKMDTALSDEELKKAAAGFASAAPVATVKVTAGPATQQLEVRKSKDNAYYAKSSVVAGVHKVANELGEGLDKSVDDFRNKKLFDFGFSDPMRVDVRDGANARYYVKGGETWWLNGKQMDSGDVQGLIDKLRDLAATKFVEKPLPAAEIELAVTAGDSKRVEQVSLAKVGADWFAKREGEPVLYQLDGAAVEELRKAATAVKAYQPPKPAKK